jgi:Holliday junction resolvasome RuvABC endonuclease subunit
MSELLPTQARVRNGSKNGGILALDLGTNVGWAVRSIGGGVHHGVVKFKNQRYEGGGMQFVRFQHWLGEILHKTQASRICYEIVRRHLGTQAAHCYGGFLAHMTAYCEGALIPYSYLEVPQIKQFMTGKGNANKKAMISAVQARGYPDVTDDNEADAIAILLCAEDNDG